MPLAALERNVTSTFGYFKTAGQAPCTPIKPDAISPALRDGILWHGFIGANTESLFANQGLKLFVY